MIFLIKINGERREDKRQKKLRLNKKKKNFEDSAIIWNKRGKT